MKRCLWWSLVAWLALAVFAMPVSAARMRVAERHGPVRTRAVVHEGFPIHRPLPVVVVRRRSGVVLRERIVYGPPIVWAPVIVPQPPRAHLAWEDGETLVRREGWTDVQLDVNDRGRRLCLEVTGRTRLEFAEVVFGDGQARVVDFGQRACRPGIYSLLDFRDGRLVLYVHLVARAVSPESRVMVRLEK